MICLRKCLEEKISDMGETTIEFFSMIGCHCCKKMQNQEEIEKYTKVLVLPLWCSFRREKNALMRAMSSMLLEKVADEFGKEKVTDKDIQGFYKKLNLVVQRKITLEKFFDDISETVYLKSMARLYLEEQYDAMFGLAIGYILKNLDCLRHGFRIDYEYKGIHFFQIGVSLDEGITESLTIEMMTSGNNKRTDSQNKEGIIEQQSDAYYFEIMFCNKLLQVLHIEKLDLLRSYFSANGLHFLMKLSNGNNPCEVYDLLALSDGQNWKEANQVLRNWGKEQNVN
jgi:hypothetical protein